MAAYATEILTARERQQVPGMDEMLEHAREQTPSGDVARRLWNEQLFVNLPLCYVASVLLHSYAAARGCTNFLFATRDCVHLRPVFQALYPLARTHTFHTSRAVLFEAAARENPAYDAYVDDLLLAAPGLDATLSRDERLAHALNKTVFVDMHGTGHSALSYFHARFRDAPFVYILTTARRTQKYAVSRYYATRGKFFTLVTGLSNRPIEMLNYDVCGTLTHFAQSGPVRAPVEYATEQVNVYHACVAAACGAIRPYPSMPDRATCAAFAELVSKLCRPLAVEKPLVARFAAYVQSHRKATQAEKAC
jgi:hypothetical protein